MLGGGGGLYLCFFTHAALVACSKTFPGSPLPVAGMRSRKREGPAISAVFYPIHGHGPEFRHTEFKHKVKVLV